MNQKKIGELIRAARREHGFTQQELADKMNISDKTVSKWECGVSHSYRYHTRHNNTTLIR